KTLPPVTASAPAFFPFRNINPAAVWTAIIENFFSALLAIYLLIIGIMVMRDSRRARGLHLIYATLKIPLVIVASIAAWLAMTNMMSSMTPPGTPGPPPAVFNAIMAASAVVQGCIALAYPMALLFI